MIPNEDPDLTDEVKSFIREYKNTFLYLKVCMTIILFVQVFLLFK